MRLKLMAAAALLLFAGGCSDDETAPEEGHTPASARLFGPTGTELTPAFTLAQGQTLRIEIRYYAADGDLITGIESEHYSRLTFTPGTLVTVAAVSGQRFFWDVTAATAAGGGSIMVGYGHDAEADEHTFGPFGVTVP